MRKIYQFLLLLLFAIPCVAQTHFVSVDWQLLPAIHTLPEVIESISLPDDYRSYDYKVKIEFPEFENLEAKDAELIKATGELLPAYPTAQTEISISAHKGFLNVRFVPIVYRNGRYQRINSFKVSVTSTPINQITRSVDATRSDVVANSILSSGNIVKIRVPDTGVYQLTNAELRRMGFSNPDKVHVYGYGGYLLSNRFSEHPEDDLPLVPSYRTSNAILFYARGTVSWSWSSNAFVHKRNYSSDYGYYFLVENEEADSTWPIDISISNADAQVLTTFNEYSLYEKDQYSWSKSGRELYDNYDYANGNVQNYNFTLPGITGSNGRVITAFSAKSTSATSFSVSVNGTSLGSTNVSSTGGDYYVKATESSSSYLWSGDKPERTTVTVTHNRPSGTSGRLNYINVNYERSLHLNDSYLAFRSRQSLNEATTFRISGANSSTVVWDVTNLGDYKEISGTLTGDVFSFTIPSSNVLREFVAVNTSASFSSVENMGGVANQNLRALDPVDMVIIVPDRAAFIKQAERLAQTHRDLDGLRVQVVTAPQVYNEFSSGTPDATAYRRLMKMLYDKYTSEVDRPKYLLLFGDCSYDNRMCSSVWRSYKPSDFLLSYQVEISNTERYSYLTDDYFGFLDDNEGNSLASDRLDIGVGRFTVRTAEEAKTVVDKNIAYIENKNAGTWKRTVCFVADDAEGNNSDNGFMQHAIDLADSVLFYSPQMRPERILADAYKRESSSTGYSYPDATRRLLQLFNQGMFMVNYTGHSGTTTWSDEKLLTTEHIEKLSSPRLPIWFTASCDFTRFDDTATSAGELALLNPNGGAIALISTSRVVYDSPNYELHKTVIRYMFSRAANGRMRLGDIMRLAKQGSRYLLSNDNKLNFNLTGNPALMITIPDYQVAIDEFNGSDLSGDMPTMSAGDKVKVKGRILTPNGLLADDFNGTIHPLAMDSRETIYTLDNVGKGAVNYTDHARTLFSGMDSIRNGQFEFTIPVPLDINYSNQQGLLNLYASSGDYREAGGAFNQFVVGGTANDLPQTDEGPLMNIYLNTPEFVWGGQVNETPYFVAELEDPNGINTVGNGIGHDLSLTVDGKTTYNLNEYYVPQAGNYTKGKVAFSIPGLAEGKHSLTFRAWNIMNKSTSKSLEFEVIKGLRPELFSITCSNSPARETTTFILSHNRPDSELDVRIAVCDFAGRELWVHTERGVSSGSYYYVDWNLASNGGQRLMPGVYLYRASIISDGSKESTKTEKIVILSQ